MSEGFSSGSVTKWEYIRVQSEVNKIKGTDATVDKLGREGWELVDVTHTGGYIHMWFKRPR